MARRATLVGAILAAAVLATTSFAWACTNFARVDAVSPAVGVAQSQVAVRGAGVVPNSAVELRWNGLQGPVIGAANADANGAFNVTGTVPASATPGVYSVIAVSGQTGVGRAAFETVAVPSASTNSAKAVAAGQPGTDSKLWHGLNSSGHLDSPAAGTDTPMRLGIGILLVGSIALAAGATVTTVRRQKALATSQRRDISD